MRAASLTIGFALAAGLASAGCGGSTPSAAGSSQGAPRSGVRQAGGRIFHGAGTTALPSPAGPGREDDVADRAAYHWHGGLGQRPHDTGHHAGQRSHQPHPRRYGHQGEERRRVALREQSGRQQRHLRLSQGPEPARSGTAQSRSQQGSAGPQGHFPARLRIDTGRLQRRGDRCADARSRPSRFSASPSRTFPTTSARTSPSAPSWRCAPPSPALSCRRWSCPASSSRPAPPRRSSSATCRRSGSRDTSTKRTCNRSTRATPSRCAIRRSRSSSTARCRTSAT